ncbi:hypothetical protein DVK02_12240 [Halobellus sp. Atlit-31R]|nr:hypothetical protein DVK02_12240 [Halobellus sp. Atlit-31R]
MRRRRLLSLVPALAVGCLSGCLSPSDADTPTQSQTPESLPPSGYGTISEFDAGEPFRTRRVGDPADDHHHRVVVWNDDSDRRRIGLRLRAVDGGSAVLDAAPTFPAYGSLLVEVFRPRDYVLDVRPPTDADRTLGIRRDFVDCNDSATHVAVRPDSSIRARVVSTALACDVEVTATDTGDSGESLSTGRER